MATQERIDIVTGVDTESARKNIESLTEEIKKYQDQLSNLNEGTQEYMKTLEKLTESLKQIEQLHQQIKDSANNLIETYQETRNSIGEVTEELDATGTMAETAEIRNQELAISLGEVSEESQQTRNATAEITEEFDKATATAERSTEQNQELARSIQNLTEPLNQINEKTSTTNNELEKLEKKVKECRNKLLELNTGSQEYIQTLKELKDAQSKIDTVNEAAKNSTAGLKESLEAVNNIAKGVTAGFTLFKSTAQLLGVENDKLADIMVRLQSGMALVQSLTALSNGFNSLSLLTIKARVAFASFNTTLLANPFVLITAAVVGLLGYFGDLRKELSFITDTVSELWSGISELITNITGTSDAVSGLTQVVNGVATAIIKLATGPLKTLIKILQGDFKGALEEVKNAMNVVDNFDDGYTQRAISNSQKREGQIQEEAENAQKEQIDALSFQIKVNEAKYGSDYRYTEEGRKLYEDYFDQVMSLYAEDSKEYQQALLEKLSYDRKYATKRNATDKKAADKAIKQAQAVADKFRKDEEEAFTEYGDTITKIAVDSEAKRTAALTGTDRLEYLKEEIKENKKLAQSYLTTATDEDKSYQDRNKAIQSYQTLVQQTGVLLDEYNNLALAEVNRENVTNIEAEIAANNKRIKSLQNTLLQEEISAEARKKIEAELDAALTNRISLQDQLNEVQNDQSNAIEFVEGQIQANAELIASLEQQRDQYAEGSTERIALQNEINEALAYQYTLTQQQQELDAIKLEQEIEINEKRIELADLLRKAENPNDYTIEEIIEQHNEEIARLWDIANNTELSYEVRIQALKDYQDAQQDLADAQKKLDDDEEKLQDSKLDSTKSYLDSSAQLLGENTAAGKAASVASATIQTYQAATGAYASMASIPIVGPALGAAAAGAAIAAGLANVKSILKVNVDGAADTSTAASVATLSTPSFPESEMPIYETHNNMTDYEYDDLNKSTRVYVLESDITDMQSRVSVAESNSTF